MDLLPKNIDSCLEVETGAWRPYYSSTSEWKRFRSILSSWLGTPYRHCTMVKGRGADCTLFIGACWLEQGILTEVTFDYYSKDWHLHTTEERVMRGLYDHFTNHARSDILIHKLERTQPLMRGDLIAFALTKTGVSNHAAVYLGETEQGKVIVHSAQSKGVSIFPLAGYFERHISNIFRIMKRVD